MSIHAFPLRLYIFCKIQLRFYSSFRSFVIEFAKSLIWCRIAAHITLGRLLYLLTYHPIFRRKKLIHLTRLPCLPRQRHKTRMQIFICHQNHCTVVETHNYVKYYKLRKFTMRLCRTRLCQTRLSWSRLCRTRLYQTKLCQTRLYY